jgi:membrane protein insertase Oxa1/YidC/SpoIIIJ
MRRVRLHEAQVTACLSLLLQIPVLFILHGAVLYLAAATPVELLYLSHDVLRLLPGIPIVAPVEQVVLGFLDLSQPDKTFIIPILVFVTTYCVLRRNSVKDNSTWKDQVIGTVAATGFGVMALSSPAALGFYLTIFNLIGLSQSYLVKRGAASV